MLHSSFPCILVIDPDVAQQQIVARLLSPKYKVLWCASLADTYGLLRTYPVQLLLVDIDHASEPPFAWITQQRKDSRMRTMPMVCTSAHASIAQKIAAFQAGGDDFWVKPLPIQSFLPRVELLMRLVATQRGV